MKPQSSELSGSSSDGKAKGGYQREWASCNTEKMEVGVQSTSRRNKGKKDLDCA